MGEKISIVKFLKARMKIIICLTLTIIISLGILSYLAIRDDYKSRVLVNILGRQRMHTQMMAKNATRIYSLMSALRKEAPAEPYEVILDKIKLTGKELGSAKEEFDDVFSTIKMGYINSGAGKIYFTDTWEELKPLINDMDKLWSNYKSNIEIILSESEANEKVVQAVIYINENDNRLLDYSERITNIVVESSKVKSYRSIIATGSLAVVGILIILLILSNVYKYLFIPLNELYRGISEIGLTSLDIRKPTKKEITPVITEVNEVFLKLNNLITLIENLNKSDSFNEILDYIYTSFSNFIPYSHIGIAIIDENREFMQASFGISDESIGNLGEQLVKLKKVPLEETSLGRVIDSGEARVINDLEEYTRNKPMRLYNRHILDSGIRSSITLPLMVNNRAVGVIFFSTRGKNIYKENHVAFLRTLANSIALGFEKNIFVDNLVYTNAMSLAKLAESRDNETGEHLNRMKIYAREIAELLSEEEKYKEEIDFKFIDDIERFSPLHDIGKVAIRDEILLKPGKLSFEEFEIMKSHAEYGARVLKAAEENVNRQGRKLFTMGIEIAEGHHEKWDGSGYPYGKKGEEIPLSARIVAIADVLDALTSERPYKKAWTLDEALDLIKDNSGKHFDPEIVRVVFNNIEKIISTYNSFRK